MSRDPCVACGEPTIFEEELGSAICTHCGTLANPSQNILDSHLEHVDTSGRDYYPQGIALPGSTLKGRSGWALAGQDKDARDRRNTIAMHEFIESIANKLVNRGYAPRAQTIFDQAMRKGHYRWGKRAKLLAGASLSISLREANKSDSLRDIAFLVEVPLFSLSRAFSSICALLELKLDLLDPAQHLPVLETHLIALARTPKESTLPPQLLAVLTPLIPSRLSAVRQTVTPLSSLVSRTSTLANLPTAPTACALLILALEGELSASIPNAGMLAQALGTRLGLSKAVVMQRYKIIHDVVEGLIQELPWLDTHEKKGKGRSKVAKRVVVAKGLKDVVQFQDEIWTKRLAGIEKPTLSLEHDGLDDDDESLADTASCAGSVSSTSQLSTCTDDTPHRKHKRKSTHTRKTEHVARMMLHPLAGSSSRTASGNEDLFEHFLTVDDSALPHAFAHPPSRLQMLAVSRGEAAIPDDELFAEGELEGFLRNEEEVDTLRSTVDWDTDSVEPGTTPKSRKRRRVESEEPDSPQFERKTKRIDMAALTRLLDPSTVTDEDGAFQDSHADDEEGAIGDDDAYDNYVQLSYGGDTEEVVEEWRPLSPGGGGFDEDRYDI